MPHLTISPREAQQLVLNSQLLTHAATGQDTVADTLKLIEHLGYIQIDTISVIERAHHHTL